ncbi:sigma-70 family RNA polymerase sigma factor [Cytophagaceae bacterium DM2B3-1]|uniref:Sigma-70 family RNA polymerase sigma factor n=1 Tax=Xanthocytophaga flava TaxID=3048013 RepID=A0AAE3QKT5_9BACT|nr:sigma-70 family RNA polymerase sigma factor [Xanthocytophaga flavus]MDJ1469589.1 sigma-70 family RNA polymerase sigma factor [Xanthocytophaga flavus]MDJ1480765.1 sigma-70 family RNA polymerase sigma factor [Xanthocytophaga flavus]MDJ1493534.1 sigma-70 family RNA polymerase sigma factor [Xanthocytophaga flavus]
MFLRIQKWDNEEKLIRACQRNDAAAQREVYNRYSRRMLGVCTRYIKDQMEAEDVMINGFLKIFEKIDQYQFAGSFEGWIRRVMVNEALQQVRRNKSVFLEVEIESVYNDEAVMHIDGDEFETEDLLALIQQLPDGYRTVFNLYAIEGYSHKEIAEQLGISENTSKSQLSRARALLQENLRKAEKKMLNVEKQIG